MPRLKKSTTYEPIHAGPEEWPVVRLSRNRKQFIEEVIEGSYNRIKTLRNSEEMLREEIELTMFKERLRVKENPWKVDPEDEMLFWQDVKKKLVNVQNPEQVSRKNRKGIRSQHNLIDDILHDIISRYANEIAGNFKPSHYRLTRSIVTFGFARLLNAARLKSIKAVYKGKLTIQDKIHIKGETEHLRSLAKIGTIVMVPTHFSNLDSITIGFMIHTLGLPPFIYGAGLNLFNIAIFAYFMNSLGAYKVDRRKKNMIYLETLMTYSSLALQKGLHSLFFPGGTRSRSGKIEDNLKLGLLSTAMEAQRVNINQTDNGNLKKIFVVPVVLNYDFVLEAAGLISDYLEKKGQERFYVESDRYSSSYKIISFLIQFFTRGSDISISVCRGMDILGNYVDDEGNSLDKNGNIIQTEDYFKFGGRIIPNAQRESEYTRILSKRIVDEFHCNARCSASHLAAFTGFEFFREKYQNLDIYSLLRIPPEELIIPYVKYKKLFLDFRKGIFRLCDQGKIQVEDHMNMTDIDELIKIGIENVGIFHTNRPLLFNKQGDITTRDLKVLFYYRNRLDGYGLEYKI